MALPGAALAAGCNLAITFNASPLNTQQRYNFTGDADTPSGEAGACSPNGDIQATATTTAVGPDPAGNPGDQIAGQHGTYTLEYDGNGNEWILYTPTSAVSAGYTESISFYGDDSANLYDDTANITIHIVGSAPGAPTIGTATAGNAQASITFTPPGSDGGSPINRYTATSNPGGLTGSCATSPCTVTGLTNGTAYTFTVTATNATGTSMASSASNSVTPSTVPGAPTGVSATSSASAQAAVTFSAPNNNGSAITGYTVTSSPAGGIDANAGTTALSHVITGLTDGTAYTFTVTATNADGTGPASAASNSVTPKTDQTIVFSNPGTQNFGTTPTLTATASSGLTVTFSSTTTSVCTITSGGQLTFIEAGSCTINANQGGNGTYEAAATVPQTFTVAAVAPGAPAIGTATPNNAQATISFTAPAFTGGASITRYTATSSPGGLTGSCSASPCVVTGLTNGTAYTFTVTATNSAGTGAPSAASNSITPLATQTISFANPGTQNFGTTPTLTATATSGLPVSFTSSTRSVCTITSGGALTFVTAGNCTINADQAGNGAYSAAPQVNQQFAVNAVVPGAPTIGAVTTSATQVTVNFTPPAFIGGAPITQYTATSSPGGLAGTCAASPCVVAGLTYGTAYTFTVTATNAAGTGAPSAASSSTTPLATQTINFANPGAQNFGTTPTLTATATSGLPVSFSSSTTGVCAVSSGGALTFITTGTCTINANQAGNGTYQPAPQVSQSFTVNGTAPGTPTIGTATAGNGQATITFTPPSSDGGSPITGYTATSNPGGLTGTCAASPCTITGLTDGTAYTFTVTATNGTGAGASSAPSNSVTPEPSAPTAADKSATTAYNTAAAIDLSGSISGAGITGVTIGTAPVHGTASVSGETVTYTPSATFYGGTDTFTYTATNPGGTSAPATVTVTVSSPAAPTVAAISAATPYNTAASIDLSGSITGADVTSVTVVRAPSHGAVAISGETATYTPAATFFGGADSFTYSATNPGGTSSAATVTVIVAARAPLVFSPGAGALPGATAGKSYSATIVASNGTAPYSYALTGTLPAGLIFDPSAGGISGTPTAVGTGSFTVTATDHLGFTGSAAYSLQVSAPTITAPSLSASVVAGTSTTIDLTADASGGPFTGAALVSLSPPSAGTASIISAAAPQAGVPRLAPLVTGGHYLLKFTASSSFSGSAVAMYTLSNAYATSAPATVTFTVSALPDPREDPDVAGIVNAEAETAKRFAQMEIDNFNGHLEQLHHDGCLLNSWGIGLDDGRQSTQGELAQNEPDQRPGALQATVDRTAAKKVADRASQIANAEKSDGSGSDCSPYADGSLGFWTAGTVNFGTTDFTKPSENFDYTTFGISAGMDYKVNDDLVAGLGFSIGNDQSFISDDGTRTNGMTYGAAVYGSYHPTDGVFLDGVIGYGWLNLNSNRFDSQSGDILDGSRDGWQVLGSLTAGYETKIDGLFVSPYMRLDASHSDLDAFSEDSSDWSAIRYGAQTIDTLTGTLGVRLAYKIPTDWGSITPKLRLEYGHDFSGASGLALSYANIPGSPAYPMTTADTARDFGTVALGSDFEIGTGLTLGANYGFSVDPQQGIGSQQVGLQIGGKF